MLDPQITLNCAGQLLSLDEPRVMGIINVTPDSFYSNSRKKEIAEVLSTAEMMLEQGASILDVGGMSTRPGAKNIPLEEELARVVGKVEALKKAFPDSIISVDTVKSEVARHCAAVGAGIINDVSAGRMDEAMYSTIADLQLPYVIMHMQGKPQDMQDNPDYGNVVLEVLDFLIAEVAKLRELGVKDLILDPGFGFGKSLEDNYKLLKELHVLQIPGLPILAGVSRKSMIYKALNISPEEALVGTAALHMVALNQGAKILRCHDVKEAAQVIELWKLLA